MFDETQTDLGNKDLEEVIKLLGPERPQQNFLKKYEPDPKWFIRKPEGMHGITHETRVLIWQEIISRILIKDGVQLDQEALRWAAATHDVRRVDDGQDVGHGTRSAEWVGTTLQDTIDPKTMAIVQYLNTWHVPSDHQAPTMTPELKVFKDADGLDRARIGDLEPRFLRHPISKTLLVSPAEQLYELSTQRIWDAHPQPEELFGLVVNAAIDMGLVSPD